MRSRALTLDPSTPAVALVVPFARPLGVAAPDDVPDDPDVRDFAVDPVLELDDVGVRRSLLSDEGGGGGGGGVARDSPPPELDPPDEVEPPLEDELEPPDDLGTAWPLDELEPEPPPR